MITNQERSQIKQIVGSPQWQTIQNVAVELLGRWKDTQRVQDTEWETIKNTIFLEGQIRGVELFFQELQNQIQHGVETQRGSREDRDGGVGDSDTDR